MIARLLRWLNDHPAELIAIAEVGMAMAGAPTVMSHWDPENADRYC